MWTCKIYIVYKIYKKYRHTWNSSNAPAFELNVSETEFCIRDNKIEYQNTKRIQDLKEKLQIKLLTWNFKSLSI